MKIKTTIVLATVYMLLTIITNQCHAQEVLTKVNGGASWEQLNTEIDILSTATTLNLDQNNHTVIMEHASSNISLPNASSANGTMYFIVNRHATNTKTINRSYNTITGTTSNQIGPQTSTIIQSDGINWYQIKGTSSDGNGIYSSNGTISSDRSVNANGKDLIFESMDQLIVENANTDNIFNIDAPNNKVGVKTGSPNSSLHVNGSVSYAIADFTAGPSNSYTMGDDDYLLFASTTSSSATINLPNASTCPGRVYRFIKTRTNNSLIFSPTIMVNSTTGQGTFSGTDVKLTIISNGTNWWKLEN